jgi:DNA-binding NarL/FixJ family response regulator
MLIVVADDHTLVRQGLLALLRVGHSEWSFREADTLDEALEHLADGRPDLLVIDLQMPGMDGGASLAALREAHPDLKIVVLTASEQRETILESLAAGVHGYVLKSETPEQLLRAIDTILGGGVYVPAALTRMVQGGRTTPTPRPAVPPQQRPALTPRQVEVLNLLAEGRSTKEIAQRLNLGLGTVKVHLAGVYRALGAHNRMEAVVKAGRFRLPG